MAARAVARTPWRWLIVLYPGLSTWVVVATGSHYWLDGVAGGLLLCLALLAVHRLARPGDSDPAADVE
jgi:hypothetical protein